MLEIKIDPVEKYYGVKTLKRTKTFRFRTGYTCLIGPNGTGKTTALRQIKDYCAQNRKDFLLLSYDNLTEGSNRKFYDYIQTGNFTALTSVFNGSEGEGIHFHMGEFASDCGEAMSTAMKTKQKLVILADGADSGMSIDLLRDLRKNFFELADRETEKHGVEAYIIITSNNFELARDAHCIDVISGKPVRIHTYEDFERYVMQNSKWKEEPDNGNQ